MQVPWHFLGCFIDEAQANCFFNSLEHGLLCMSVSPCVFDCMGVHMCSCTVIWFLCERLFSIIMLFHLALKPHCDLFSCLPMRKVEKYNFCFPPLILLKVLNVTPGGGCVIDWNAEGNNMNSFPVSYNSSGQYKICNLSEWTYFRFCFFSPQNRSNMRKVKHLGTDMSDWNMKY